MCGIIQDTFLPLPFFMETGLQNLVAQIGPWTLTGTPKTMTPYGGAFGLWTLVFHFLSNKTNKTCSMALPVWFSLSPRCGGQRFPIPKHVTSPVTSGSSHFRFGLLACACAILHFPVRLLRNLRLGP